VSDRREDVPGDGREAVVVLDGAAALALGVELDRAGARQLADVVAEDAEAPAAG
jgi:hypothetical protein